jgi:hypothetical protein
VVDRHDWYRHVNLVATVEEMHADVGLADIDRLAQRYTNQPCKTRDSPRVSVWARVENLARMGRLG